MKMWCMTSKQAVTTFASIAELSNVKMEKMDHLFDGKD